MCRNVTAIAAMALLTGLTSYGKDYRAERYLVDLQLDSRGGLTITETVDFRFGEDTFRYVYRDISPRETDGISAVEAWMDGRPCRRGAGPGEVEIGGTSPVKVRWHFAPFSQETHTFTVRYRVDGVIRPGQDAHTLIWRVLPQKRSYWIRSAEVRIQFPPESRPLGITVSKAAVETGLASAEARLSNIKNERDVYLRARFAPEAFGGAVGRWAAAREAKKRAFVEELMYGLSGGVLIVVIGCVWMIAVRGSATHADPRVVAAGVTAPPSGLAPALAGKLAGGGHAAEAVLLDLARRGVLRIEESEPGMFKSRRFSVVRQQFGGGLAEHEREVLEAGLRGGSSAGLSDFAQRVVGAGSISKSMKRELVAAGFFDEESGRVRHRLATGAWVAFGSALAAGLMALLLSSGILTVVAVAFLVVSVIGMILIATVARHTMTGAMEASRWRGYGAYLREAGKGHAPLPAAAAWERVLPYAVAFGAATALIKRAQKEGGLGLPKWFSAYQSAGGAESFAAFMAVSSAGGDGGAGAAASGGGGSGAG